MLFAAICPAQCVHKQLHRHSRQRQQSDTNILQRIFLQSSIPYATIKERNKYKLISTEYEKVVSQVMQTHQGFRLRCLAFFIAFFH